MKVEYPGEHITDVMEWYGRGILELETVQSYIRHEIADVGKYHKFAVLWPWNLEAALLKLERAVKYCEKERRRRMDLFHKSDKEYARLHG